jgi:hypothetical protein
MFLPSLLFSGALQGSALMDQWIESRGAVSRLIQPTHNAPAKSWVSIRR